MEKTDEYIESRIIWKAGKYKLPSAFAFFYNDVSPNIQKYLDQYIDKVSGPPVLFFTKPSTEWTLLCTRQVICNDNNSVFKINISDIDKIKSAALENASKDWRTTFKEMQKTEWHELNVVDKRNNVYVLHSNKGPDLFALWNILLMATRIAADVKE